MQTKLYTALSLAFALQYAVAHPAVPYVTYHVRPARSTDIGNADLDVEHYGNFNDQAIKLADDTSSSPYTMEFVSTASSPRKMIVWNKVGSNGENSGAFEEPAVTFTLEPGASQIVAFEANTQGGFCDFTEEKRTANGQYDCPYGEFNIAPYQENGVGWSAADVSVYNQDPAPEGQQNGIGYPCNLDISAEGSGEVSNCEGNYYWAATGTFGMGNDLGVVVPYSDEARFSVQVGDMRQVS